MNSTTINGLFQMRTFYSLSERPMKQCSISFNIFFNGIIKDFNHFFYRNLMEWNVIVLFDIKQKNNII